MVYQVTLGGMRGAAVGAGPNGAMRGMGGGAGMGAGAGSGGMGAGAGRGGMMRGAAAGTGTCPVASHRTVELIAPARGGSASRPPALRWCLS